MNALKLILTSLILFLCSFLAAQPPNDNCADAIPITVGTECTAGSYTSIGSTSEDASVAPNPSCSGYQGGDVWFTFQVPASGNFRVESDGNRWVLYTGSCGTFTQIACDPDVRNFSDLSLAGQTLYLRAYSTWSSEGSDFTLCIWEQPVQPNDFCVDAISLTVGQECTAQNFSSIYTTSEPVDVAPNPTSCNGYLGGDVWFKFDVPASGNFRIETSGTLWTLYSGTCGNFTQLRCDGDDHNISDLSLAGQTLYLRAYKSWSDQGSDFTVCIWEQPVQPNDFCVDAINLTVGQGCNVQNFSSIYTTSEPVDVAPNPSCNGYLGGDVWFKFDVPASGNFRIETSGTLWTLYSGTCGNFTQIRCEGNNHNFRDPSLAGQTLYLRAYKSWSDQGSDFTVCIWEQPVQPNDFCADAISLTVGQECTAQNFSSVYTTSEPVDVAANPSCGFYYGGDVWFTFEVPASGNFRVEMDGNEWALYSGTCGSFTEIRCEGNNHNFSDPSLAGQTLYLRAFRWNSDQGLDFTLCIWEQPTQPNDFCADAINIVVGQSCVVQNFSTLYTTAEPTDVAANPTCGFYYGGDVWFTFDVPASGDFRIEVDGNEWVLYSGSCGNFTQILCAGDSRNFSDPSLAGETLFLRTFRWNSDQGADFTLCIWEIDVPENNLCSNATNILLSDSCIVQSFTTRYSTAEDISVAENPSCGFYYGGDVWFTFTAPESGQFALNRTANSNGGTTQFEYYTGTCGNFQEIVCSGDSETSFNDPALGGELITVRAFSWNSRQGADFDICIRNTTVAPNDNCADAIALTVGESCTFETFDSYNTTHEEGIAPEPSCGYYQGGDIWFTFEVPTTGQFQVNRNNLGSGSFNYALYTGTCGNLVEYDCSTHATQSLFDAPELANQTVYLRVFRWNSQYGGEFELCIVAGDCNGEVGGTSFIDNCGDCVGGNTGFEPCVQDCNGVYGGTAYLDDCATCVGGNTGQAPCVQDCNGDWGGTAYIDDCEECVGGSTGLEPCSFDCPTLLANIGDACDDNDPNTSNDTVTNDCECAGEGPVTENTALLCSDGIDNDGNGLIDCEDPACQELLNNLGCLTCFEDGSSFADSVIAYVPTCTQINPLATDPNSALGVPDYSGDHSQAVSLGRGYIKLAFTNNTLVNSGTEDPDLYVFEVGPLVEPSFIELRPLNPETELQLLAAGILDSDGDGYYEFGGIGGSLASVDIDAFFNELPANSVFFDAIKIVDGAGDCSTNTPGADIDGVCALSNIACNIGEPCDDGDPTTINETLTVNCDCVGESIYDCPELSANIGDACDDGNASTENDEVTADCECVGTVVYDCPELSANIGEYCDDGNPNTEDDVITSNCECVGVIPAPINNDCANAIALSCGDSVEGTSVGATSSGMVSPSCSGGSHEDVFYALDVIEGQEYTVSINGADYDGVLVLYTGACGNLTELDCADEGFSGGVEESITFTAAATETLVIRTYDWSTSQGSFTISVQCVQAFDCTALSANIGDTCDDANPATSGDVVTADCECVGVVVPTTEVIPQHTPTNAQGSPHSFCDIVIAYNRPNAENFRWRFDGNGTFGDAEDIVYTRGFGNPGVRLSWVNGLEAGVTYNVGVEVMVDGVWGGYSVIRPIDLAITPNNVQIRPQFCGGTYGPNGVILSESICQADYYRFRLTPVGGGAPAYRTSGNYALILNGPLANLAPGDYYLDVKVSQGGQPGDFGPDCLITIGGAPSGLAGYVPAQRSVSAVVSNQPAVLYPNPNSGSEVRLELSNLDTENHQVVVVVTDMYGRELAADAFGHQGAHLSRLIRFDDTLPAGMYLVQVVIDGELHETLRLVVN